MFLMYNSLAPPLPTTLLCISTVEHTTISIISGYDTRHPEIFTLYPSLWVTKKCKQHA